MKQKTIFNLKVYFFLILGIFFYSCSNGKDCYVKVNKKMRIYSYILIDTKKQLVRERVSACLLKYIQDGIILNQTDSEYVFKYIYNKKDCISLVKKQNKLHDSAYIYISENTKRLGCLSYLDSNEFKLINCYNRNKMISFNRMSDNNILVNYNYGRINYDFEISKDYNEYYIYLNDNCLRKAIYSDSTEKYKTNQKGRLKYIVHENRKDTLWKSSCKKCEKMEQAIKWKKH